MDLGTVSPSARRRLHRLFRVSRHDLFLRIKDENGKEQGCLHCSFKDVGVGVV